MLRLLVILGLALAPCFASVAAAQQPPATSAAPSAPRVRPERQSFTIAPATSAIVIDGELNEAAWGSATAIPLTYEWQPGDNVPASIETICLVTFDAERLYVAFRAKDPNPGDIRAHYADRDVPFLDDTVGFMIDTFNDRRRGYQFRINPRGVQMDAINSDVDGSEDWSWDGIWDAEGRVTDDGYIVEVAVPFSSLRFPRTDGVQTWASAPRATGRGRCGAACGRRSPIAAGLFHLPVRQPDRLPGHHAGPQHRIRSHGDGGPDGSRRAVADPSRPAADRRRRLRGGAVGEVGHHAERDVQRDEEKRPFFLEGADFFSTPISAVFTRSIVDPSWGAKLTGKEGRSAFGAFVARDEVTTMTFPSYERSGFTSTDSPLTSVVGRYRHDIAGTSAIGLLVASRAGDGYANHVGGIDGLVRLGRSNSLRFQYLASQTDYPSDIAARFNQSDAAFTGHAYAFSANRNTQNWFFGAGARGYSPEFRADSGFVTQTDLRSLNANATRVFTGGAGKWYSRIEAGVGMDRSSDFSGGRVQWGIDFPLVYAGPMQSAAYYNPSPSHEYFAGRQFDNFRHNFGVGIRPTGDFAIGINGTVGGAIDFGGAREADQVRLTPQLAFNLFDRLALELSHTYQTLDVEPGRLFTANLTQGRAVYHLNRRTFVRAILQHTDVELNAATNPGAPSLESRRLFSQYLFSFKINPQTGCSSATRTTSWACPAPA